MFKQSIIGLLLTFTILMLSLGCSKDTTTADAKEDKNLVRLAEIMKSHEQYSEKEVSMYGTYAVACGSSCCPKEFVLKDGIYSIKVNLADGVTLPKLSINDPVKVFGIIKPTVQSPYLLAQEVKKR